MDLSVTLDRQRRETLAWQLYDELRRQIVTGDLRAGARLPSSRRLAQTLGVGRVTVTTAYDRLVAGGYAESRPGAGTFVTDIAVAAPVAADAAPQPRLTAWGRDALRHGIPSSATEAKPHPPFDFTTERTFPHIFPYDTWRRLLNRYLSTDDTLLERYGSAGGFEPLRQSIAGTLARRRGIRCAPEQVIVVSGVQQALDIISRLLIHRGDRIVVESPGYTTAYELFRVAGAELVPAAVDDMGLDPMSIASGLKPRLLFVTPGNQFPQGGTLSLARRLALLAWSARSGALILEDDYDSELRYDDATPAALKAIDEHDRVIYVGTFSKVLFPALRLAYVILPEPLVDPFLAAKRLIDRGSPTLTQAAIADFIDEGHYGRHVRRLQQTYGRRRAALVDAVRAYLPGLPFVDTPAGLHIMLQLPSRCDERRLVGDAAESGIAVTGGAAFYLESDPPPTILLGFTAIEVARIEAGIARLATILRAM